MPEFWGNQCLSLANPRALGAFGAGPAGEAVHAGRNGWRPGLGGTEDGLWWGQGQTWCFRGLFWAHYGLWGAFACAGPVLGWFGQVWGAGDLREAVRGFYRGFLAELEVRRGLVLRRLASQDWSVRHRS